VKIRTIAVLAVGVSVVSIVFYTVFFSVKASDIYAIGFIPIAVATSLSVMRLVTQGLRFHKIADNLQV
jgi:hypothetical protein